MSENLNNIQSTKDLKNIYINLINEFESHFLSENKKLEMFEYLKKNCDVNFSNDMIIIIEDFNSIISQSIQAIKSLLSENERLIENKNLKNNNYFNYNQNNLYNDNQNIEMNSNQNIHFNDNQNNQYNNQNLISYNNLYFNSCINNEMKSDNNVFNLSDYNNGIDSYSNDNNYNFEKEIENKKQNENNNLYPLNYDYSKNMELKNNIEPLKKSIREKIKAMAKDNMNYNNILNNKNLILNNNNNGKNSFRMIFNSQISNTNKNNSENTNIENDNQNKINKLILNSKKKEMEILKVTNEILKLIEIINKKKNYFIEKYMNSNNLNIELDYKNFLENIINYKFDIITLNNILNDLNDFLLNSPKNKSNKKKENSTFSKEKILNENNNEQFPNTLRKYSNNKLDNNKPPFVNATNPYSHLFS